MEWNEFQSFLAQLLQSLPARTITYLEFAGFLYCKCEMGWRVCELWLVRSLKLSTLVHNQSRLVFTGSIPVLHTSLWFQITSEADIWLSSYDHLTDVGRQRGGCQQLLQRKSACFLLNKKEALSGLIQVNDDKEMNGREAGRVYGCQL